LDNKIKQRTLELKESNDRLTQSNAMLSEANEQLRQHYKMQSEFINIGAHELRTPVQPIIAMTEMLSEYPRSSTELGEDEKDVIMVKRKDLKIIDRNAARLER